MENIIQLQNRSKNFRNPSISLREKVYLDCPFEEKDLCKNLGGQWDPILKKWFVPKGHGQSKFNRWLSKTEEHNLETKPEDNSDIRNKSPLVTGPRILLGIDDNDRTYLKLYFDDYPEIARKMAKGDSWPSIYAKRLREKAAELMETQVYLKTSQLTKAWDPLKWIMDIIPATDWDRSKKVKNILESSSVEEIPSKQEIQDISSNSFDDNHFCVFPGNKGLYLIFLDEITHSNLFDSPDNFDEFKKYLENCFEASYFSKKTARYIAPTMSRIRIGNRIRSKRNGYRLVISKVDHHQGISIFHAIHLDDKLLNEDFPTDREIKGFKETLHKCNAYYGPEKIKNIINELGASNA